ncbi:MAG: PilZ domain-containing protein [Alcanivoracaceae bacterium]|nr:PilZ domain-containing protein [Alcanivoracaceae bacterium]
MSEHTITENRRHPRIFREDTLSVKVIDSARGTPAEGPALYCSTVDISASGMQILITDPLPIRQLLDIWIVLSDNVGTFNLTGKINRIVELDDPDEPEGFLTGIELLDTSPDIKAWREIF